jgi:hypothetical protein
MGGKQHLVRTFMVCIDGSALFLKVAKCFSRPSLWLFSELFVGGVLRTISLGFLVGVTYEDLVPLWLVTLPPNLP